MFARNVYNLDIIVAVMNIIQTETDWERPHIQVTRDISCLGLNLILTFNKVM